MANTIENFTENKTENKNISTAKNSENVEVYKNAFKIIFENGVRLTPSVKKFLKDECGCYFSPLYKAYICPIQNKIIIQSHFEKRKINATFQDVIDIDLHKQKPIRGMEARIITLEEEVYSEDLQLWADIKKYDCNLSIDDFSSPPIYDGKNSARIATESDFHDRCVALQKKKQELENLKNSLQLHEKEGEQGHEILEHLSKNEIGDAQLFVNLHKEKYIFDPTEGKEGAFYIWNGNSWKIDLHKERYKDFEAVSLAYTNAIKTIQFQESIKEDLEKRIHQLRTHRRRKNVLETVSAYISFKGKWDNLPSKLPCANGILDLKTGVLLQSHPNQFIKKVCPTNFDPNAKCPKFEQFLKDITLENEQLERFIARLLGYALLGIPREEKVFYFYGNGRNGKGTLMQTIQSVLGPLSKTFPSEMLLIQRNPPSSSSPNPEKANLEGVRLAVFSEINEGRKIDASEVKNLSGRDLIPCRRLFSNIDLQIVPSHTMIIQTNYKPKAPSDDIALWSRNILIPFNARFVKNPREPHERPLKETLKEELLYERSGILNWLIAGCLEYQSVGLQIPNIVLDQTEGYRKENDGIGLFIEEMCITDSALSTQCQRMENCIKEYCKEEGLEIPTRNEISKYLAKRFKRQETKKGNIWAGIGIKMETSHDE